jgi:hypothetical protein
MMPRGLSDLAIRRVASRISVLTSLFVDFLHQCLQRAPANLAQVSIIVRQELLVATGAVDVDMSPANIVVGFPREPPAAN